jgi:hypothetical protein
MFGNCSNISILFYSNIKLHENPFSGCRFVPCGGQAYGQTDMTNLIEDFRNFAMTTTTIRAVYTNTHAVTNVRAVLTPSEKN